MIVRTEDWEYELKIIKCNMVKVSVCSGFECCPSRICLQTPFWISAVLADLYLESTSLYKHVYTMYFISNIYQLLFQYQPMFLNWGLATYKLFHTQFFPFFLSFFGSGRKKTNFFALKNFSFVSDILLLLKKKTQGGFIS